MASKKNKSATSSTTNPQTLKIGSRVRCTDDGVEGRIVWANSVAVKIEWTDGEKVTWRRDSLATRPIEILDANGDDQTATLAATDATTRTTGATEVDQLVAPSDAATAEPTDTSDQPQAEPVITPTAVEQPQAEPQTMPPTIEMTTEASAPTAEPTAPEPPAPVSEAPVEQAAPGGPNEATPATAKPKRQRKATAEPREKKVSALDAAARILAEAGQAMTCKELIGVMASKGYWSSPGGRTPDATLCSAILREINVKGDQSRFVKTAPGRFAFRATV